MLRFFRGTHTHVRFSLSLHWAAKTNDVAMARELLLGKSINVNVKTKSTQRTPLIEAFRVGAKDVASVLLEQPEIEIDMQDINQDTPLHAAIRNENISLDVIRKLLDLGVKKNVTMNKVNLSGRTPLVEAILAKRLDVIALLKEVPEFRDDPRTRKELAISPVKKRYMSTVSRSDFPHSYEELTDLHRAARRDDSEWILRRNFSQLQNELNHQTKSGRRTPLHEALAQNSQEAALCLLKVPGIQVATQDFNQDTPLHVAIRIKDINLEIIKQILVIGLESANQLNVENYLYQSPLEEAVLREKLDIIALLLDFPEFKNDPKTGKILTSNNNKILFRAVEEGNLNLVKTLLSYSAIIDHASFDAILLLKSAKSSSLPAAVLIEHYMMNFFVQPDVCSKRPTLLYNKQTAQDRKAEEVIVRDFAKLKIEN